MGWSGFPSRALAALVVARLVLTNMFVAVVLVYLSWWVGAGFLLVFFAALVVVRRPGGLCSNSSGICVKNFKCSFSVWWWWSMAPSTWLWSLANVLSLLRTRHCCGHALGAFGDRWRLACYSGMRMSDIFEFGSSSSMRSLTSGAFGLVISGFTQFWRVSRGRYLSEIQCRRWLARWKSCFSIRSL